MKSLLLFVLGILLLGCTTTGYIVQMNGETAPDNMLVGKFGSLQVVFFVELKKEVTPEAYETSFIPLMARSKIPEKNSTITYKVTVYNPKKIKYRIIKKVAVETRYSSEYTGEKEIYNGSDPVKNFELVCPPNNWGVTRVWPVLIDQEVGTAELIPVEYELESESTRKGGVEQLTKRTEVNDNSNKAKKVKPTSERKQK